MNNTRCKPYRKDAPPVEEPLIDAETQAELEALEPQPQVPARGPRDCREILRDIDPAWQWKQEHPSQPWRTKTHHGEFDLGQDDVWRTTCLPNPGTEHDYPRVKRVPSMGQLKSDYLEELKEKVVAACGPLFEADILAAQHLAEITRPSRMARPRRQGPQKFFKGKMLDRHISLPVDLWYRLQEIAAENGRSVSYEVEYALAVYAKEYGVKKPEPDVAVAEEPIAQQ